MKFTPRRVLCYAICFVVVRLVVYDLSLEDDEGYYGIPATVDEDGFPAFVDFIGSPNSTLVQFGECQCQLVSVDCLEAIRCLPDDPLPSIHAGIVTRSLIQNRARYWRRSISDLGGSPFGMVSQYVTVGTFREWLLANQLPQRLPNLHDPFANGTLYPYCVEHNLRGRLCFFHSFGSEETFGQLEEQAWAIHLSQSARVKHRSEAGLVALQRNPLDASPLQYLLAYAHISRITLNLRAHMHELYKQRLKSVNHTTIHTKTLRVAMHLRRGDACNHKKAGYAEEASVLYSVPQTSGRRLCYETHVYLNALQRIQQLAPDRHLIVYVATDHSRSLMEDIEANYKKIYQSVSWRYLEYPRQIFDYFGRESEGGGSSYIESPENKNKAILGETAVLDIWHLSHGQVFIGHLGSRFGKLGWWQATARHNSFVPYFTVDGHSTCCDIDEPCGEMARYVVSMENCLAIFMSESRFVTNATKEAYWELGATHRKGAAEEELIWRRNRGLLSH